MAGGVEAEAGDGAGGFVGDVFVFLGFEGAGGIDEGAAGFEQCGAAADEGELLWNNGGSKPGVDGASSIGHCARMNWRERITSEPGILRGKPCIKGTRIPVALILGYVASGKDATEIAREFPDVTALDVEACLHYARDLADYEAAA